LTEMNKFVTASSLPPMITLVLHQYPHYGGQSYQIAKAAEQAAEKAGAVVIPTEDYYRQYDGMSFKVTRWEGHPDEVAHYIWASMIADELRRTHVLPPHVSSVESPKKVDVDIRQ
jgi:hypothetical protein